MKLYDNIKKYIKEYYKSFLIIAISFIVFTIPFPYFINTPGGLINVSERVKIENGYEPTGTFNLAYVSELKATIPTLLVALLKDTWDVVKISDVTYDNQTLWEMQYRDTLLLKEANNNAIIVAYNEVGKKVDIINQDLIVSYVDTKAKTDLVVGDVLLDIEGEKIDDFDSLTDILSGYEENDTINIKVENKGVISDKTATLYYDYDRIIIGIVLIADLKLDTEPQVELKFKKSESGPSGGLMTSIAIYDHLTKEDLTHGKTIVGTGTIDREGNVGLIGGVEYKLRGAIKEKADIFLVPSGSNYEEAMELKKDNSFDIEIVSIATFDEAINYLRNR